MNECNLQDAVYRYYNAMQDVYHCPAMILSDSRDPRPAQLMWELENARIAMFDAAGIDVEEDKKFIEEIKEN